MSGPLVSVVINNFNYARFLRGAIDSVLAQTWPRTELIVVDDGSTDESPEIIRSYGDRLKAVFKRNGGQASACNTGFAESRGELVLFLDSDDTYHPDAVAAVVEAASAGAALIQFRMDLIDGEGRRFGHLPGRWTRLDHGDVVPQLLSRCHFIGTVTSANAFRRDALEAVLPVPEDVYTRAVDGYLINTVAFRGQVAAIERVLGAYRVHGRNEHRLVSRGGFDTAALRKRLEWTRREIELVRSQALARGLPFDERAAMRYAGHVGLRLISLCMDPATHPYPGDARWKLALHGARAAMTERTLRPLRRPLQAAWFPLLAAAPNPIARRLAAFFR